MKLLFLINCLSYGGAEKNLKLVSEYFLSLGFDITICSLNYRPTTIALDNRIKLIELEKKEGFFLTVLWRKYEELKVVVQEEAPNAIISFLLYANVLNVLIGKKLHIPSIISERGDPYIQSDSWKSRLMMSIFHGVFNRADGAVFQTEKARDFYQSRLCRKSIIIPNPVICKPDAPIHNHSNSKHIIAFVGRFELRQKRQDLMLQAFQKVHSTYPEYSLHFWGDGEDMHVSQQMANKLGLSECVCFNSVSKNILHDIVNCEMYVLTSDYEGIPNTLIEAMSIGLPCVSTDCSPGGARLLIESGVNGVIVPCGDVDAIADAIVRYVENPAMAARHGRTAIRIKGTFSYSCIMNNWNNYITSIIHNYKKR